METFMIEFNYFMSWWGNLIGLIGTVAGIASIIISFSIAYSSTKQLNNTRKELQTELDKLKKINEDIKTRENIMLDIVSHISKTTDGPQFIQMNNDKFEVINNQRDLTSTITVTNK